ncbi:MAG: ArnT family glycosyltransferase [Bacteroidia bacterium]
MIARNFLEADNNILYPRIDYAGQNLGIVAGECPVFSYVIFFVSKIFGYDHWYGRLINLIVSSLGIFFFGLIIQKYFGEKIAFNSVLILLCSIWFSFSRKIMPDTFSASIVISGIYFGVKFSEKQRMLYWALFIILTAIGGLSKMPSVILMGPMLLFLFNKDYTVKFKVLLSAGAACSLSIVASWYFYWQPYLLASFKNQLYFPFSFADGLSQIICLWKDTLHQFYFASFNSYISFIVFLVGFLFIFIKSNRQLLLIFIFSLLPFLYFIIKSGNIFPTHNYYIIPFVPVMSLIAGYGLYELNNKFHKNFFYIIYILVMEAVLNQHHDFHLNKKELYKTKLELIAENITDKNDKIAINGGLNPQEIYFSHRKGWSLETDDFLKKEKIAELKEKGCRFLFINKHTLSEKLPYHKVFDDENYSVYEI